MTPKQAFHRGMQGSVWGPGNRLLALLGCLKESGLPLFMLNSTGKINHIPFCSGSPKLLFWRVPRPFAMPRVRAKVPGTWRFLIINPGSRGLRAMGSSPGSCRFQTSRCSLGHLRTPVSTPPLPRPALAIPCRCAPHSRGPEQGSPGVSWGPSGGALVTQRTRGGGLCCCCFIEPGLSDTEPSRLAAENRPQSGSF